MPGLAQIFPDGLYGSINVDSSLSNYRPVLESYATSRLHWNESLQRGAGLGAGLVHTPHKNTAMEPNFFLEPASTPPLARSPLSAQQMFDLHITRE
jgi:hypothetical protein